MWSHLTTNTYIAVLCLPYFSIIAFHFWTARHRDDASMEPERLRARMLPEYHESPKLCAHQEGLSSSDSLALAIPPRFPVRDLGAGSLLPPELPQALSVRSIQGSSWTPNLPGKRNRRPSSITHGNNIYGRSGVVKCGHCRFWRRKAPKP